MPPQCSSRAAGAAGAAGANAMAVDPPAAAAATAAAAAAAAAGDEEGGKAADEEVDAACALAAAAALDEVTRACEGLCASNEVRQAATTPLMCVEALLRPPQPQGQHAVFAECCGAPAALGGTQVDAAEFCALVNPNPNPDADPDPNQVDAAEFCALVHLWDTLKLDKIQQGKRGTGYLPAFTLALARQRSSAATA